MKNPSAFCYDRDMDKYGRKKGRSLFAFPDDFTVIDLETTGISPRKNEIIEIACVKYRNGIQSDICHTFVCPDAGPQIPFFITQLTGITPDMLEGAPSFEEVSETVWSFLEGEMIVGHNVNFDINFLYDRFYRMDQRILNNDYVDTLRISRRVLPELSHRRLTDLCDYYHIENIHHRADADCDSTRQALAFLKETAKQRGMLA